MTTPCEKLLAEIEARLAKATPGPRTIVGKRDTEIERLRTENAKFREFFESCYIDVTNPYVYNTPKNAIDLGKKMPLPQIDASLAVTSPNAELDKLAMGEKE